MKQGQGVYPDPPPPYDPSFRATTTTAVPTIIIRNDLPVGPGSSHMVCPHCRFEIDTSIHQSPSMKAYLTSFVLALLQCWLCVCVPCCFDECYDVSHYCPNCNAYLGKFSR